jgi:hypothetical protein
MYTCRSLFLLHSSALLACAYVFICIFHLIIVRSPPRTLLLPEFPVCLSEYFLYMHTSPREKSYLERYFVCGNVHMCVCMLYMHVSLCTCMDVYVCVYVGDCESYYASTDVYVYMYMHACIYIYIRYMCIYVYACMYIYIYVIYAFMCKIYPPLWKSLHVCTYYMHVYMYASMYVNVFYKVRIRIYANVRTKPHTYIRTKTHTYIRTKTHTYIRTKTHTYIRTKTNTCIRTKTNTHIHTYIQYQQCVLRGLQTYLREHLLVSTLACTIAYIHIHTCTYTNSSYCIHIHIHAPNPRLLIRAFF